MASIVFRGRWWTCSDCEKPVIWQWEKDDLNWNFCPYCGKPLDEDDEEDTYGQELKDIAIQSAIDESNADELRIQRMIEDGLL